MIAHVVLLAPRPDLTREEREGFVSAFEHAARDIPSVRRVRVGRRLRLGEGYESKMAIDFGFTAIFEFDDAAGLRAYLEHPAHRALGAHFHESLAAGLAYDYEMADIDRVRTWLETGDVSEL